MRDRINRDLDHYYQLGDDKDLSELDAKKQRIL